MTQPERARPRGVAAGRRAAARDDGRRSSTRVRAPSARISGVEVAGKTGTAQHGDGRAAARVVHRVRAGGRPEGRGRGRSSRTAATSARGDRRPRGRTHRTRGDRGGARTMSDTTHGPDEPFDQYADDPPPHHRDEQEHTQRPNDEQHRSHGTYEETPMDQPRLLGDRYEVGELLGRGGMAEVHRGRDLRLGRTVAIKSLRVDLARDPSFQNRFRREAQSAASLNHPNIVAIYDTGEEVVDRRRRRGRAVPRHGGRRGHDAAHAARQRPPAAARARARDHRPACSPRSTTATATASCTATSSRPT